MNEQARQQRNDDRLTECFPAFAVRVRAVLDDMEARGFRPRIQDAHRSIADQLKAQFDVSLDKRKIHLEHPIRTLGDHELELRLHQDIVAKLKIHVESTTPKPITPEPEYRGRPGREGERPTGPRTEKRGRPQPARAAEAAEKPARPAKGEKAEKPAGERPARTARPPRKEKTG